MDYRVCDLGAGPQPFPNGTFDFATYTDVLEHHSFSPKRVLQEIHRVLRPGGQVILLTTNHASIYNRLKLLSGGSVHDDLDYFFDSFAGATVYGGHHRECTRAEVKTILQRTGFEVKDCRVIEQEWTPLVRYLPGNRAQTPGLPKFRGLLLCALGRIRALLHLPLRR